MLEQWVSTPALLASGLVHAEEVSLFSAGRFMVCESDEASRMMDLQSMSAEG
jgi:hypothetical protein